MTDGSTGPVTQILDAVGRGDPGASAELLPLVYAELRKLAEARMARTPPGQTLQPTALVHEAYLRLIGDDQPSWNSRGHFFGAAAQAMRRILVDRARKHASLKRGGDRQRVSMSDVQPSVPESSHEILALNDALEELEKADAQKAQVVMLRHFAGLSQEQTAAALGVSVGTVEREWRFSRAFLHARLGAKRSSE